MTILHPNGIQMTISLLALGEAMIPGKGNILDLGCGDGAAVEYLRSLGYQAVGIDKAPEQFSFDDSNEYLKEYLKEGDLVDPAFPRGTFDALMAECSLSVCGDIVRALSACRRVLKKDGVILCSDVYFSPEDSADLPPLSLPYPSTRLSWHRVFEEAGFDVFAFVDQTQAWNTYYYRQLWEGIDISERWMPHITSPKGCRPGYFLLAAKVKHISGE